MTMPRVLSAALWLSLFCLLIANRHSTEGKQQNQVKERGLQIEERAASFKFMSSVKLTNVMKSEEVKAGIPDVISNLGVIGTIAKTDFKGPPGEVVKTIGDAVVPIIVAGLSLIPGGALIGGIISGIWGLFSGIFGGPAGKSPMEKIVDELNEKIDELRNHVDEVAKKITKDMRNEMTQRLSKLTHAAIQGELSRNDYICSKYAMISKDYSDDLNNNRSINEFLRIEMIALLNDCDNFLKDTSEGFVHDDFADVLWVPSVMTTLIRLAFLTEITNYGVSLKLDKNVIAAYWSELDNDIRRIFKFADSAVKKRLESLIYLNKTNLEYLNFSSIEYEGCKMQAQLLYFHRKLYPYGPPKFFRISNDNEELNIADFNVSAESDDPHHIQVYYNNVHGLKKKHDMKILNCINGESVISGLPILSLSFRVIYVPNKSYQIRVLFILPLAKYRKVFNRDGVVKESSKLDLMDRNLIASQESDNTVKITLTPVNQTVNNSGRFKLATGVHQLNCKLADPQSPDELCYSDQTGFSVSYIVDEVVGFNVLPENELKGKIVIEAPEYEEYGYLAMAYISGVELIILPPML